jgi:hypothetical protein
MIKLLLNMVPRGVLQRLAGWLIPLAGVFYAGRGVECPLCGARYRRFMPYGYVTVRRNALCPRCLALERHRLLWLWLSRETDLLQSAPRFLHIAPEVCLMKKFEKIIPSGNYITADLESPLAQVKMDVQNIPFPDGSFDVIFCNHVLEHVEDDRRAMREMWRVMRPGGWGVMLSPVDTARHTTFEDDTVVDRAERTRLFGQYDHRRVYGLDYADRLREAGFTVEEVDYFAALPEKERRRYGLLSEILYVVRK